MKHIIIVVLLISLSGCALGKRQVFFTDGALMEVTNRWFRSDTVSEKINADGSTERHYESSPYNPLEGISWTQKD